MAAGGRNPFTTGGTHRSEEESDRGADLNLTEGSMDGPNAAAGQVGLNVPGGLR